MLLEVLVTVGILAVGLLGVAAMQINSLKSGVSALQRGEAAILVASMSDKMRTNSAGVYAGSYSGLTAGTPAATISNSAERAQNDFDTWQQGISAVFSSTAAATGFIICPTTFNCVLRINWSDTRADSELQDSSGIIYRHIASVVF